MSIRGALSRRIERRRREKSVFQEEFDKEFRARRDIELRKQARIKAIAKAAKPSGSTIRGAFRALGSAQAKFEARRAIVAKKRPIDFSNLIGTKPITEAPVKKRRTKRSRRGKRSKR